MSFMNVDDCVVFPLCVRDLVSQLAHEFHERLLLHCLDDSADTVTVCCDSHACSRSLEGDWEVWIRMILCFFFFLKKKATTFQGNCIKSEVCSSEAAPISCNQQAIPRCENRHTQSIPKLCSFTSATPDCCAHCPSLWTFTARFGCERQSKQSSFVFFQTCSSIHQLCFITCQSRHVVDANTLCRIMFLWLCSIQANPTKVSFYLGQFYLGQVRFARIFFLANKIRHKLGPHLFSIWATRRPL